MSDSTSSPRCRTILRRIVIVALGLYVLRFGLGLGLGYLHYQNTPDFSAYLASHLVAPADLAPHLPRAGVVQTQSRYQIGEVEPAQIKTDDPDRLRLTQALQLELDHGLERLLDLQLDFDFAVRKQDLQKLGMVVSASKAVIDPRMRLRICVELVYPEPHLSDSGDFPISAYVDTYVVSGSGPTELNFLRGVERRAPLEPALPFLPAWALIAGLTHNIYGLPEEGLIYHFQSQVNFDWQKNSNGSSGPGKSRPEFYANSEEYSYRWKGLVKDIRTLGGSLTSTNEVAHTRKWNEQIW
jgi:hypothetical protein